MTTGLTYDQYVTQIATMAVVDQADPAFVTILPQMITFAENKMCRDIDFLSTVDVANTYQTTNGGSTIAIPIDDFVTLQQANIITPAGTTDPAVGTLVPLLPVTKEYLDYVYPSAASKGAPQFFAMLNQNTIKLGPWADGIYNLQAVGTFRPDSLSSTNTTTFISTYLPDLFIMASMVYISAFQRNFGRAVDDPTMALTYEGEYKTLLSSTIVEEARKKFQSSGWTSMSPAPAASPTR